MELYYVPWQANLWHRHFFQIHPQFGNKVLSKSKFIKSCYISIMYTSLSLPTPKLWDNCQNE